VLPWSRVASTPERNINWTHGLGPRPSKMKPALYVALLFAGFVLIVFLPTHWALQRLFMPPH
jgi:hypothetical protein